MPNKLIKANDGSLVGNSFFAVGSVQQTFLSAVEFESIMGTDWVLADGRDVSGSLYETITGNSTAPDVRGLFLRTVGGNANATIGGSQGEDVNQGSISASSNSTGAHTHNMWSFSGATLSGGGSNIPINQSSSNSSQATQSAGSHNHTITISAGSETRPVNITVNTFIKIN